MINALVTARHSDPKANAVINVLAEHTAGNFSNNKVRAVFLILDFFK